MITFRDVDFSYGGGVSALDVPALEIGPGLTMVVGRNGSGKSTLLRLAAGIERPNRGNVTIDGRDLWRDEAAARQYLGYVPEHPELTPYATIADVMQLVARLRGAEPAIVAQVLDRVGLLEVAWHTVRELSMGQRRRALFATALIGEVRTAVLDEPLETMDRAMRDLICEWTRERRAAGATVLVATHDFQPFAESVDVVIVVESGRIRVVPASELGSIADRNSAIETLASNAR